MRVFQHASLLAPLLWLSSQCFHRTCRAAIAPDLDPTERVPTSILLPSRLSLWLTAELGPSLPPYYGMLCSIKVLAT